MVKCPVCLSDQVVFVEGPRTTSCPYCGASWIQDAGQQTAIDRSKLHLATVPASAGALAS
jgi:ribosomal protein S27E